MSQVTSAYNFVQSITVIDFYKSLKNMIFRI